MYVQCVRWRLTTIGVLTALIPYYGRPKPFSSRKGRCSVDYRRHGADCDFADSLLQIREVPNTRYIRVHGPAHGNEIFTKAMLLPFL